VTEANPQDIKESEKYIHLQKIPLIFRSSDMSTKTIVILAILIFVIVFEVTAIYFWGGPCRLCGSPNNWNRSDKVHGDYKHCRGCGYKTYNDVTTIHL
jgi:hypothetical protein